MHIEDYYRLNMSVNNLTMMSENLKSKHNKYWDSYDNKSISDHTKIYSGQTIQNICTKQSNILFHDH